jgi:NADH oxidase (H2O2-forming)
MKQADIVVIGGSAAGIAAAITARRHYPEKSIILIRKEEKVLIPCGIPYIFGTLGKPENNLIPDGVLQNNNIELIINEAVELHAKELNPKEKKVVLANGELVLYDKLILATGSSPAVLPIPGFDKKNVYTIKKDVKHLQNLLDALKNVKDLVILGCGFIGVEFADECKKNRDINVTVVEMLDQCLQIVFGEGACKCCQEIEDYLKGKGISIVTGTSIAEVLGDEKITAVKLSNGEEIKADALIVGVGVSPNVELARKAGLATSKTGIVVDTTMRTSDPNIFACGDCATKFSFFTGQPSTLRLASIATTEARIAGANLYEISRKNPGALGVFSTAVGDLTVAIVNGELIGGAVKGGPSAGELINAISACIQNRMRANDIAIFQIGTHPAVTASPIAYPLLTAAEIALKKMKS